MANKYHATVRGIGAVVLLATSLALPIQVAAASDLQGTYDATVKCYVANAHARGQRQRAGDTAKAEYYREKAAQAYDAAQVVGTSLGLSRARMTADFDAAQARQLPAMVRDETYFRATVADCKAMGLM